MRKRNEYTGRWERPDIDGGSQQELANKIWKEVESEMWSGFRGALYLMVGVGLITYFGPVISTWVVGLFN